MNQKLRRQMQETARLLREARDRGDSPARPKPRVVAALERRIETGPNREQARVALAQYLALYESIPEEDRIEHERMRDQFIAEWGEDDD